MKRLTRRQVRARMSDARVCLVALRTTGESDAIDGYAVRRIGDDPEYFRTDWCMAGFAAVVERMLPAVDTAPLRSVEYALAADLPIDAQMIDAALRGMKAIESGMCRMTAAEVSAAAKAEEMAINEDERMAA
ncbi:MAG: hypothetical protein KBE22_00015 [Candidatus Accumulibacter sp.]|nr:hypothetical protein [Accumulibacter sp.]